MTGTVSSRVLSRTVTNKSKPANKAASMAVIERTTGGSSKAVIGIARNNGNANR